MSLRLQPDVQAEGERPEEAGRQPLDLLEVRRIPTVDVDRVARGEQVCVAAAVDVGLTIGGGAVGKQPARVPMQVKQATSDVRARIQFPTEVVGGRACGES